jgi:hypothetical protein
VKLIVSVFREFIFEYSSPNVFFPQLGSIIKEKGSYECIISFCLFRRGTEAEKTEPTDRLDTRYNHVMMRWVTFNMIDMA